MALLGTSFQIGRSALAAYQSAIAITGQNIANVGNPNYTRLSGRLTALEGGMTLSGIAPGGGVNLSSLQRHVDAAVEARLRMSASLRAGSQATYDVLSQVESLYNELSHYDLSTQLSTFFNSFSDLQNDPDEITARNLVLDQADAVISTLRRQRTALLRQATDLNAAVRQGAQRANQIATEIASLNEEIVTQDARGPGFSAPLRDRRDALLRELSELMDIQVRERDKRHQRLRRQRAAGRVQPPRGLKCNGAERRPVAGYRPFRGQSRHGGHEHGPTGRPIHAMSTWWGRCSRSTNWRAA